MKRLSSAVANGLLLLLSVYASLVACDVVAYYATIKRVEIPPKGLYRADEDRSYALTEGFSGEHEGAAGPFPVRINRQGYRGGEWRLDQPLRLLAVGDSFTFGLPLPEEDGFPAKIERLLGAGAAVFNAGIPGYGVPHVLATIKRECPVARPRHVLYFYYLNDTRWDNMTIGATGVVDGWFVTLRRPGEEPRTLEQIREGIREALNPPGWTLASGLALRGVRQFLSERQLHPRQLLETIAGGRADENYLDRYSSTASPKSYPPELAEPAAAMIGQMRAAAEACSARFTMVILPSYAEGYYGVVEPATERLLSSLAGRDVDVLDLRVRAPRGKSLIVVGDGHYDRAGTDWVAAEVTSYLRARYPDLTGRAAH